VVFCFFPVCYSNIPEMAERICAKFTGKTCLVPRSDEFQCQGQRSKCQGHQDLKMENCRVMLQQMGPISRELVNGFAPNLQGKSVWSLTRTSLNIKVKGQGHQGQKRARHSRHPRQRGNGTRSLQMTSRSSGRRHSVAPWVISAACVRLVFGKSSSAPSCCCCCCCCCCC